MKRAYLVTGTASGIGAGLARRLLDDGHAVACVLLSDSAGYVTGALLEVDGGWTALA